MIEIRKNLIFLTGFMGSGKSTIGPILANTLGFDFIDIDKEIESITQKKIVEIFLNNQEKYFRQLENEILKNIINLNNYIVSLGGGTLLNPNNLKLVLSNGILIYLRTDLDNLYRRLRFKSDRPLLLTKTGEHLGEDELKRKIREILNKREKIYKNAQIVVNTGDKKISLTIEEIIKALKQYLKLSTDS